MTNAPYATLAGIEGFREAGREMSSGVISGDARAFFIAIGILAVAAATTALVGYLLQRRSDRPIDSCAALFRELCDAHRLDAEDRETMLDAAAAAGMRGVEVFVRPDTLDGLAEKLSDPRAKERCVALRRRLFGDVAPDLDETGEA